MQKQSFGGMLLIAAGSLIILMHMLQNGEMRLSDPGYVFGYFWPAIFVIPLGILFHVMYFGMTRGRAPGLLIPGGILCMAGVVCQISMLFDAWSWMWPGFPLAVAFGLFEFYLFSGRNKWLLIPIYILGSMSVIFFLLFGIGTVIGAAGGSSLAAMLLIVAGLYVILRRKHGVLD
ncbi:MAG: hypothetical protein E6230_04075 [Paenibacillus dendritiformis]|uniref:hypothetical protein n=1 Tax=Paenibacillus dendritiformis TaxID=130049 RepID=UPI00143DD2A7|nr:hypothetical protein [Paenibacillus dendritiformis]MDU5141345.1 hypothetical protein [Paenibacillus dendritiformis]NKI23732.1 hypothetical protein [Paenibacillus dendritiformis]NRF98570.1 hypothetical protein [Paenibacillus dendritiformis]GIO72216.1 hypothetical protein J27TS7_17300 [Paenibacillus dendritiformis]